jgi:hypothetical protein
MCGLVFCYMFSNHFVTSNLTFIYCLNRYFWIDGCYNLLCYVTKLSSWLYFQMYKITRFFGSFKFLSVIQLLLLTEESSTSPLDSKFNRMLNCLVSLLNSCRPFFLILVISDLLKDFYRKRDIVQQSNLYFDINDCVPLFSSPISFSFFYYGFLRIYQTYVLIFIFRFCPASTFSIKSSYSKAV